MSNQKQEMIGNVEEEAVLARCREAFKHLTWAAYPNNHFAGTDPEVICEPLILSFNPHRKCWQWFYDELTCGGADGKDFEECLQDARTRFDRLIQVMS